MFAPDPKWLEVFKLPLRTVIAVSLTSDALLAHLSKEEIAVVAKALREGSPSFYTYVYSPPVSLLQGKRLVWTPNGLHNQDHYPFSFHDFAWKVLLERKDEFIAKDEEHKRAEEKREKAERHRRGY